MNAAVIADVEVRRTDLLTTGALLRRPPRAANLQAEITALRKVTEILVDDPRAAPQQLLDTVLRLCDAGSAGLSLSTPSASGQTVLRWEAVSGALAAHKGAETPLGSSICGLCLEAGAPILVSRPERAFRYLSETRPSIVESLIVPLYDSTRRAFGTLWIAHHDATSRFCSTDARIAEQFAPQMVLALRQLDNAREHREALTLLESHGIAEQIASRELAEQRNGREMAEASESSIRRMLVFKEAVIREVHHRVRNTIQIVASLLSVYARATASAEVRVALQESDRRLRVLAKVHELLYGNVESEQEVSMPELLHLIGDSLRLAFAETTSRVNLRITSDQLLLSPKDAIPMALMANEVMTNAYKHAFPDNASGEIAVDLTCTPDRTVILQISDDGIGLRSKSGVSGLGLQLTHAFAAQLAGELTLTSPINGTGTVVRLSAHPAVTLRA